MARSLTTKNLFDKRGGRPVMLGNAVLQATVGEKATVSGCWLIYGAEKNGKSWFALWLARQLAKGERVHYISAEEGLEDSFKCACKRAGITTADNILWDAYLSVDEIIEKFSRQRSANIIVIDNLTMYEDELKKSELKKKLLDALPHKLFVFLAHEERKQPYPALARYAKKMANVYFHVQGLRAEVTSRFGGGGHIVIDEKKASIYHGVLPQPTTPMQ